MHRKAHQTLFRLRPTVKLMTHEREKSADNGRFFFGRMLLADKNRPIHDTRAQIFGGLWRKHGQFRRRNSCSVLRTGCMNECLLNFKIISRRALRHIRPKRHFVCAFENEIDKHKLSAIQFVNAIVRLPIFCSFYRFLILFITVIGRQNVTHTGWSEKVSHYQIIKNLIRSY